MGLKNSSSASGLSALVLVSMLRVQAVKPLLLFAKTKKAKEVSSQISTDPGLPAKKESWVVLPFYDCIKNSKDMTSSNCVLADVDGQ